MAADRAARAINGALRYSRQLDPQDFSPATGCQIAVRRLSSKLARTWDFSRASDPAELLRRGITATWKLAPGDLRLAARRNGPLTTTPSSAPQAGSLVARARHVVRVAAAVLVNSPGVSSSAPACGCGRRSWRLAAAHVVQNGEPRRQPGRNRIMLDAIRPPAGAEARAQARVGTQFGERGRPLVGGRGRTTAAAPLQYLNVDADRRSDGRQPCGHVFEQLHAALGALPGCVLQRHDPDLGMLGYATLNPRAPFDECPVQRRMGNVGARPRNHDQPERSDGLGARQDV